MPTTARTFSKHIEVTLKAKLPEVAVAAGDYKTELALTAMRKIYPKRSKKEVHVALRP